MSEGEPNSITAPTARVRKAGRSPAAIVVLFVVVVAVVAGALFFVLSPGA